MNYEDIIYEKDGTVAIITLNRPEVLNAYTIAMVSEMAAALDDAAQDSGILSLIITGAGRGFCSGVDLRDREGKTLVGVPATIKHKWRLLPVINRLWVFDKPVICAINGMAAGAGTALAMICDIRIASDKAQFLMAWARRGMVPDHGASYFLARIVGLAKAYELALSGDAIDATEMERVNIVSRVVPHDELVGEAKKLALHLSKGSPIATQLTKQLIRRSLVEKDLYKQMEIEGYYQPIAIGTEDYKEMAQAAREKRKPVFKGK
jgi:2-(1,2-epoxy-1,2-dihydrophenyl)acetyl-CoA isomerase